MSHEPGLTFDKVAESYHLIRPSYPAELVDAACSILELDSGSTVVEVGCGTGKLTRDLAARGLSIDAVDPGADLVGIARRHVDDSSARFHLGRFEDVELPMRSYDAVFSATAFHWVDPSIGWGRAADLLRGGGLALLTHTVELRPEGLAAWRDVLPEAAKWVSRDPETLWAGVEERKHNISEVWAWITKSDLARPDAGRLFGEVQVRATAIEGAMTADQTVAEVRTTSGYLLLDPERRARLEENIFEAVNQPGGGYRSATFAVLAAAHLRR